MSDFLLDIYFWSKSLHVIAVITWMAGLFYLPRLYVYHVEGYEKRGVEPGSEMDLLFQRQERLLLTAIMNPSLIVTWLFGLALVFTPGIIDWSLVWPWAKGISVILMTWFHYWLAERRKDFAAGENVLPGRRYRMMNEFPTILMLIIVFSVIVKF
jgi:protoporphyrinogen IX oxidase